jgi:hypothetical protein
MWQVCDVCVLCRYPRPAPLGGPFPFPFLVFGFCFCAFWVLAHAAGRLSDSFNLSTRCADFAFKTGAQVWGYLVAYWLLKPVSAVCSLLFCSTYYLQLLVAPVLYGA